MKGREGKRCKRGVCRVGLLRRPGQVPCPRGPAAPGAPEAYYLPETRNASDGAAALQPAPKLCLDKE